MFGVWIIYSNNNIDRARCLLIISNTTRGGSSCSFNHSSNTFGEKHTTARSASPCVKVMLQKLFTSTLRLRVLLLAYQILGLFPFAWSSPLEEQVSLHFSVPLFLWSCTLQVVQMIQIFILPLSFPFSSSNTVGSIASFISFLTLYFGCFLGHLTQICKCSTLADLLSKLTFEHHNQKFSRRFSVSVILGQVTFATVTVASCIISVKKLIIIPSVNVKIMYFATVVILLRNTLIVLLYREILMVLADKLECNTEGYAKQMPLNLSSDVAVVLPEQIMEQQLVRLHRLERQIREVSR